MTDDITELKGQMRAVEMLIVSILAENKNSATNILRNVSDGLKALMQEMKSDPQGLEEIDGSLQLIDQIMARLIAILDAPN